MPADNERFLKIYANLPVNLRSEIIAVLPDVCPITWNVASLEISNDTELSKKYWKNCLILKLYDQYGKKIVRVELNYLRPLKNIAQSVINNAF